MDTEFYGGLTFNRPLTVKEVKIIENFSKERHEGNQFPGIWCQWTIDEEGESLVWDGIEKFYNYVEWLEYLIKTFFNEWNVLLNGEIEWDGGRSDRGLISVTDSVVTTKKGTIKYE